MNSHTWTAEFDYTLISDPELKLLPSGISSETALCALAREVLRLAQREADLLSRNAAHLRHQNSIRARLRIECDDLGDNDWPDDLHLADVIEKHLARPAYRRLRELEAERDALAQQVRDMEADEATNKFLIASLRSIREALTAAGLWKKRENGAGGTGDCAVAAIGQLVEALERIGILEADLRELEGASVRASGLMLKAEKDAARIASLERALLNWQENDVASCKRIKALERENREKCLELAEKAGRIRGLEEERNGLKLTAEEGQEIIAELSVGMAICHGEDLKPCVASCPGHLGPKASAACKQAADAWRALEKDRDWHRRQANSLEVSNVALGHRERRLEAAIEDGIAHVQESRKRALGFVRDPGAWESEHRYLIDELDLAHEVLSVAQEVRSPGGSAVRQALDEAKRPLILEGIARIEERLHRIESTLGSARKE